MLSTGTSAPRAGLEPAAYCLGGKPEPGQTPLTVALCDSHLGRQTPDNARQRWTAPGVGSQFGSHQQTRARPDDTLIWLPRPRFLPRPSLRCPWPAGSCIASDACLMSTPRWHGLMMSGAASAGDRKTPDADRLIGQNHDGSRVKILRHRRKIGQDDRCLISSAPPCKPPDQQHRRRLRPRPSQQRSKVGVG